MSPYVLKRRNALVGFDIRMARQRPKPNLPIVILDFAKARDEVDIDQRRRPRQPHLHQRNQALPACNHSRLLAQLMQELCCLSKRLRAMVRERM